MADTGGSQTPAQWAADPGGRHELRYWDGARWTDHVSDRGVHATDSMDAPSPAQWVAPAAAAPPVPPEMPPVVATTESIPPVSAAASDGKWYRRRWVIVTGCVIAAVLLLGVGGAIGSASSKPKIDDLTAKNTALEHTLNSRHAKLQDEEAAAKADAAQAKRVKAEQDKKVADDAATAKAAQDKATADAAAAAKAQQDAAAAAAAKMDTITSDGVYQIGVDTNPGHWKTDGGAGCYYAVLNSTNTQDIATNNIVNGPATIDLPAGKYFDTTNCGTWTRVG